MPTNYQFSIAPPSLRLEVHPSGRYLRDAGNKEPVYLHAYTAWSLITQVSQAEIATFLSTMQGLNVNALILQAIERDGTVLPSLAGDTPFTGTTGGEADLTTPREAYWAHVDWVLNQCAARGIHALLYPIYYGASAAGWGINPMPANGATKLGQYGAFLGARYANQPNIIWVNYADALPNSTGRGYVKNVYDGIRSTDVAGRLHGNHYARPSLSTDDATVPCDINFSYTKGAGVSPRVHDVCLSGWSAAAKPVSVIENYYAHRVVDAPNPTAQQQRSNHWEARLSGASSMFGDEWVHGYGKETSNNPTNQDWRLQFGTTDVLALAKVRSFFVARQWWLLEPRPTAGTDLLTAGGGTRDSNGYKCRALARDGNWGAVYVTDGTTCTVNLALFSGTVTARWYDPVSGTYSAVTGGPTFAASGTHAFVASSEVGSNSGGGTDWVLVLERNPA